MVLSNMEKSLCRNEPYRTRLRASAEKRRVSIASMFQRFMGTCVAVSYLPYDRPSRSPFVKLRSTVGRYKAVAAR
jgi:hypothetical protein